MALQIKLLSQVTSDVLIQMIILKLFNSVLYAKPFETLRRLKKTCMWDVGVWGGGGGEKGLQTYQPVVSNYSRTSMARTLMARLPRLFRTEFLRNNPLAADLGKLV